MSSVYGDIIFANSLETSQTKHAGDDVPLSTISNSPGLDLLRLYCARIHLVALFECDIPAVVVPTYSYTKWVGVGRYSSRCRGRGPTTMESPHVSRAFRVSARLGATNRLSCLDFMNRHVSQRVGVLPTSRVKDEDQLSAVPDCSPCASVFYGTGQPAMRGNYSHQPVDDSQCRCLSSLKTSAMLL